MIIKGLKKEDLLAIIKGEATHQEITLNDALNYIGMIGNQTLNEFTASR